METRDAAEMLQESRERLGPGRPSYLSFEGLVAVWIATLAMLLAITSVAGANAGNEEILNQEKASNAYSYFQAKHIRATTFTLMADNLEAQLGAFGDQMAPPERQKLEQRLASYRADAQRLNDERRQLLGWAADKEEARDRLTRVGPSFDIAEGLFQIAIVMASVALLLKRKWALWPSAGLGLVALILAINGFLDLVPIMYEGPDRPPV